MNDDKEKFWDNLTKDYITTDQKIDIIREHNREMADDRWAMSIEALREWLEKKKDE